MGQTLANMGKTISMECFTWSNQFTWRKIPGAVEMLLEKNTRRGGRAAKYPTGGDALRCINLQVVRATNKFSDTTSIIVDSVPV